MKKKIPALKATNREIKTTITNLDTTLNDLLSGISIKNDSKGKAKLTIPHPFCKCG
jgi:DNA-directed RNA polymerase subunit L